MADATGARLTAEQLPALLGHVRAALDAHRDEIDELNVFPVPDGDTGTNLALTVAAAEAAMAGGDPPVRAAARGALEGARGNSGVIGSQVLRALLEAIAEAGERGLDAVTYAQALSRARTLAYGAVAAPVEGTMLTVMATAAGAAATRAASGRGLREVSAAACAAASAAVEATTGQLDALREAGVVDAGGRGLEVLLAAVHAHLTGQPAPVRADVTRQPRPHQRACAGGLAYRFEVEYLLEAPDEAADALRERLGLLGDSVAVISAGDVLRVHVHTDDIGGAIEEGARVGRPYRVDVSDLGAQVDERQARHEQRVGAVAVLDGAGLRDAARELGAVVVPGRAGALPAVADLLNALGEVAAERVVLLPGHADTVATARQTVEVAVAEGGRDLEVLEAATSPCQVLAALAVRDPEGQHEEVVEAMRAAAAGMRSGELVAAVRDADTPVGRVRAGQPLVVVDGAVAAAADDWVAAAGALAQRLGLSGAETATLLIGASAGRERGEVEAEVRAATAGEVDVLDAGHGPARYSLGAE